MDHSALHHRALLKAKVVSCSKHTLDWSKQIKICEGIARGLSYLPNINNSGEHALLLAQVDLNFLKPF